MLIIPYYIAVLTVAVVAALTASFTMVGQEILARRRKRENGNCKPVSCNACKHGPKPDESRKKACAKCANDGFGRGFERQVKDES